MSTDHALDRLGERLEEAARRDLRPRGGVAIRGVAALLALAAIGAGAAVASGVFSGEQVARGMPAGSALFGGTHPTCTLEADRVTYACTLSTLPTAELSDDWTDAKEIVTIDKHIAGGCIGQDKAGRRWKCYLGHDAVEHEILAADLLGQYAPEPGHG